jgi:hypothetical protein
MEVVMKRDSFAVFLLFCCSLIIFSGCTNKTPVANDINVSTQEETPVKITLGGSDPEGATLTWHVEKKPANGSLSGTEPNLIYTPESNFNGTDSFSYTAGDGKNASKAATVTIVVKAVNDTPVAKDDAVTIAEDTPIIIIDVLANDTDIDGDNLVVFQVGQGNHGQVTINTDNKLAYKPEKDFCGDDSFTYTISDGKGGSAAAKVDIKVTPVNDPPKIISKPITTTRVWGFYCYDVNAIDPDIEDKLVYSLTSAPEGMTIDPTGGMIEFKPTSAQSGNYNIIVKVEDPSQASDIQTFTLAVASLTTPLKETLVVENLYNPLAEQKISSASVKDILSKPDDKVIEIPAKGYICFDFSNIAIPQGGKISSVTIFIEHFEDDIFSNGQLQWNVGAGWPDKPAIYGSMNVPIRSGKQNKAVDSWDITSLCETTEKINSMQLNMQNKSGIAKTYIDSIYAIVSWY